MAHRLALFADRCDAGRRLAESLDRFRSEDPVVVALPRGGVPVGYEVAAALEAPLDILLVRKIGAPYQPEYAIGAIAEGGVRFIRAEDLELVGVAEEEIEAIIAQETEELERRGRAYRGDREPLSIDGRTVLLIDDGIATGSSAVAAGQALKARGASRVVLAVPVGPPGSEIRLRDQFDEVVCLAQSSFVRIGIYGSDFEHSDRDVIELLAEAHAPTAEVAGAPDPPHGASRRARARAGRDRGGRSSPPRSARRSGHLRPRQRIQPFESPQPRGGGGSQRTRRGHPALRPAHRGGGDEPHEGVRHRPTTERLVAATRSAQKEPATSELPLAYFGASTGAAAALCAAADVGGGISAVVSRGGRPDLAAHRLGDVEAPTLLIVGGADWQVLELNEQAAELLRCEHEVAIVPGATHLFEEPGALERVCGLAGSWLLRHLAGGA